MMRKLITLTLPLIFTLGLFAQENIPFDKKYFKESREQKKAFKEAEDKFEEANEYYEVGKVLYKKALPLYLEANEFNPNSAELNYKIGRCYLFTLDKIKSIEYFEKALKLKPDVAKDIHYMLGQAYHLDERWDDAIDEYKLYKGVEEEEEVLGMVRKKINECERGKKLSKKPERVFIDNVGPEINTEYPEYGPVISTDESVMMFTSRRPSTTGGKLDPGLQEYMEDIYISEKKDGKWTPAKNIGEPINTDEHDATVAVSPDGQKMMIYRNDKGDGNLLECELEGEEWSKPKELHKNVNTKAHESSACYSYDGKTLYFVSTREDGLGGRDIWKSQWNPDKERWSDPVNLGPTINTKYNEESVLIHPDGVTMYFSSEGHGNIGGYDIFKTTLENGKWTKPKNLGYPINSPDNDVFFVISGSGRHGYYSSFKRGGEGEKDIYKITFLGPAKPPVLSAEDNLIASITAPVSEEVIEKSLDLVTKRITIMKGTVKEIGTLKPVGAEIELIDVEENETLAKFESNEKSGKYLVSLPAGKNYGIAVKAEGYLFHSENVNVPDTAAYSEIRKNIELQPLEVGSSVILKNIFFDYDKATLRDESINELNRLTELLVDNPSIKIEISGHTDHVGSDAYNERLSQDRAQSVVQYLIDQDISKDRLVAKGYGESKPIATNETEEGRQLNRRTEFKILAK